MTTLCLEFPVGAVKHFPAGSYYEQISSWTGEVELELMRVTHSAWYTFKHTPISKWTEADLKLLGSLRKTPTIPPSRRLENFIISLFRPSAWAYMVLERLANQ